MIAPSARKSSVFDAPEIPSGGELHLWLCNRETSAGSDTFLREVLSRYTGSAPAQLEITRGLHGKPALSSPVLPLAFNLSDSGDWLAMAVSGGAAVGVDLEYCDPCRQFLKIARRCFSTAEQADLQACAQAQRGDRFYDYWTLKEAHVKAGGGSLGRELEATGFTLRYGGAPPGTVAPGSIVSTSAIRAWYCLLQPLKDYRLALCCRAQLDFTTGLRLFELHTDGVSVERPLSMRAVSAVTQPVPGAVCL